jgi:hypothetical protein
MLRTSNRYCQDMSDGSATVHVLHEGYVREDEDGDLWQSRDADDAELSPSIRLRR